MKPHEDGVTYSPRRGLVLVTHPAEMIGGHKKTASLTGAVTASWGVFMRRTGRIARKPAGMLPPAYTRASTSRPGALATAKSPPIAWWT